MSQFSITCAGIDASTRGIGKNISCPSFSAGQAGYLIGSSITSTPTKNLFTNASDGKVLGTPDAIGLKANITCQVTASVTTAGVMTVTASTADPVTPGMQMEGSTLPIGSIVMAYGTNGTTGTGGNGTYQLAVSPSVAASGTLKGYLSYFELPFTGTSLFTIAQAVTLVAFGRSAINNSLLADGASGGSMGLLNPGGSTDVQAFGRDTNSFVVTSSASAGFPRANTLDYSMMVAQLTTTTAQAFIQRSGFARVASVVQTRTAGTPGTTTPLRFGYPYVSASQNTQAWFLAAYSKLLSAAEMDALFLWGKDIAVRSGFFM